MRPLVLFVALFAFYVALSGQIDSGFLMTANLLSALVFLTALRMFFGALF